MNGLPWRWTQTRSETNAIRRNTLATDATFVEVLFVLRAMLTFWLCVEF